jgi:hypothetical protein
LEATKQKEEKRKKPKPEEQEGMPQRFVIYYLYVLSENAEYGHATSGR